MDEVFLLRDEDLNEQTFTAIELRTGPHEDVRVPSVGSNSILPFP